MDGILYIPYSILKYKFSTSTLTKQPNIDAKSPTIAVRSPIIPRAQKKATHPPPIEGGGTQAKMIWKT